MPPCFWLFVRAALAVLAVEALGARIWEAEAGASPRAPSDVPFARLLGRIDHGEQVHEDGSERSLDRLWNVSLRGRRDRKTLGQVNGIKCLESPSPRCSGELVAEPHVVGLDALTAFLLRLSLFSVRPIPSAKRVASEGKAAAAGSLSVVRWAVCAEE